MRPDLTSDRTMPAKASILRASQSWRMWGAMWEFCRATACPGRSLPTSSWARRSASFHRDTRSMLYVYNRLVLLLCVVLSHSCDLLLTFNSFCLIFLVGCLLTICKEKEEAAGSFLWDLNPKRSGVVSTSRVLFWLWLETIVLGLDSREKKTRSCRLHTDSVRFEELATAPFVGVSEGV